MINLKIISIALPCLGREDYCKVAQNQNIISEIKQYFERKRDYVASFRHHVAFAGCQTKLFANINEGSWPGAFREPVSHVTFTLAKFIF